MGDVATVLRTKMAEILGKDELLFNVGVAGRKEAGSYALETVAKRFIEDFREILSTA